MYTISIAALLCAIIGTAIAYLMKEKPDGIALGAFSGLCCGAMLGAGIAGYIGAQIPTIEFKGTSVPLVAAHSSEGVSGTFVWGTGSIESETRYNFMTRNDDGSFSPASIEADRSVRIVEDKNLSDVGYWTTTYVKRDVTSSLTTWALNDHDHQHAVSEELRVPVGTVRQGFSIK